MLSHDPLISCLYRQKCYWRNRICHLQLSAHRASTISIGAQLATKIWNASHCYWIQSYVVSLFDKRLYSTSQISMQCLTDLIFSLVVVESIIMNPRSAVLYHYLRQSFESHYQAFYCLPPCRIRNLSTPHSSKLGSLPKMDVTLFVVWATILYKSSSMLCGLQWMWTPSRLVLGVILDMGLRGDSIYTVELMRQAALASYVLFVINFFVIHQNKGPAQWGNTCWQKLTLQS